MGYMTPIGVTGGVEFADDRMQQARDEAILAADDALAAASYETSFPEVLDQMGLGFTDSDRKTFMKALRTGDKQTIGLMIYSVQQAFDAVVDKKARAILESTQ